jgi:AraC family transcriptional regulator
VNNRLQEKEYRARINRVMDFIQQHIGETLTVSNLAGVACFSPYHFHRIFSAFTGETLNGFIQRLRIEKAASLLVYNPGKSITEIALDVGFGGSASFARVFKSYFGMSASQWRNGGYRDFSRNRKPDSKIGKTKSSIRKETGTFSLYIDVRKTDGAFSSESNDNFHRGRKITMSIAKNAVVTVEQLPEMTVAYVRHTGPYKGDAELFGQLYGKLMQWAGPRGLLEQKEVSCMSVYHDDPEVTDENRLRVSACLTVPADTPVSGEVGKMKIDGGSYAVARFELAEDEFQEAWNYVYGEWLPESGYQPDDRPCFERCCNDPATHPEKKHIIDICVPVKPI